MGTLDEHWCNICKRISKLSFIEKFQEAISSLRHAEAERIAQKIKANEELSKKEFTFIRPNLPKSLTYERYLAFYRRDKPQ